MSDEDSLSEAKRALIARMLAGAGAGAAATKVDTIPRRDRRTAIPLSAGQRQVWLHEAATGDPLLYTESVTIHRKGACDISVLEASLRLLVERHESLRCHLDTSEFEPGLAIEPVVVFDIPFDDLTNLPAEERDGAAIALATADAKRPFDLAHGPLFRARIVRLAADDHRLYLTLHHLIFDGVAIYNVVLPELAALYEASVVGRPSPLAPLPVGYGDYAVWQRQAARDDTTRKAIDHWRTALDQPPAKLDLAGPLNRPAVSTRVGAMETCAFPADLSERIRSLSRAEYATPYMTLLASFATLLFRYSGEEDMIIGGVTDLRHRPELANVVGYFLNTVPLRARPRADLSFNEFLGDVRRMVLDTLGANEVPFDEVVRALDLRQSADIHPLFDILFSVEPPAPAFPDGWDLTQMDVAVGSAKFDLYLEIDERPEGYIGRFLYSSERFDQATIQRFIRHWLTVLDSVTSNPEQPLSAVRIALPDETAAYEQLQRAQGAALPLLPELLAEVAQGHPERTAISFEGRTISYGELDALANGVAVRLGDAGFGRGSVVGVLLDRTLRMVAALIGIMRAGAAYLPLDPALPPARLDWIASDARLDALVTEPALSDRLALVGVPVIGIEQCQPAGRPTDLAALTPGDLAYVLYTSGSTGHPKGVEIEHGALINFLGSMQADLGFTADDRLLAVTTISFDIAGLELFLPLISGGTVILAPTSATRDLDRLRELVQDSAPTIMQATPATWRGLIDAGLDARPGMTVLCGGEAMSRELADVLTARFGHVWNLYGPTETTIWSSIHLVRKEDGPVPIGAPIAGTSLHVLGADGWPVRPGAAGELYIGGVGIARGYRRRPDLTADRFVHLPFAPAIRLYRTGDLVRARDDGALLYVGRGDHEAKIRGHRVAVEEVERALHELPGVAAAAVRSWPDASGAHALVAYVVQQPGHQFDVPRLREQLASTLPDYMIPSRFQTIGALPLTPNNKIDRNALAPPGDVSGPAPLVPLAGKEAQLAELWQELLGVSSVGYDDGFFDLGGHSLLVAKLLSRIDAAFGRKLTMASVFRAHRLGDMARELEEDAAPPPSLVAIQPEGTRPPLLWLDASPRFRALALAIGHDRPFLGVPIDGVLHDIHERPVPFEACAVRVAELIRTAQPRGPYYIGGWCTAGILAFAVASHLRSAGEDVRLLILAEAENPAKSRSLRVLSTKTAYHLRRLARQVGRNRIQYLRKRLYGVINNLKAHPAFEHHGDDPMREALDFAAFRYRPPHYAGPVAILCSQEWVGARDAVNGWMSVLSGPATSQKLAGDHDSLLSQPDVIALAKSMKDALDKARPSARLVTPAAR